MSEISKGAEDFQKTMLEAQTASTKVAMAKITGETIIETNKGKAQAAESAARTASNR